MSKTTTLQIRIDEELKDAFYAIAEGKGYSPSELIRVLMQQAVSGRANEDERFDQLNQSIIEITLTLYRVGLKVKDRTLFDEIINGNLLWLYKDNVSDFAQFASKGDRDSCNRIMERYLGKELHTDKITENDPAQKRLFPNSNEVYEKARESFQKKK